MVWRYLFGKVEEEKVKLETELARWKRCLGLEIVTTKYTSKYSQIDMILINEKSFVNPVLRSFSGLAWRSRSPTFWGKVLENSLGENENWKMLFPVKLIFLDVNLVWKRAATCYFAVCHRWNFLKWISGVFSVRWMIWACLWIVSMRQTIYLGL